MPLTINGPVPDLRTSKIRRLASLFEQVLEIVGYPADAPGRTETPERMARFWWDFLHPESEDLGRTFPEAERGQLIAVKGIKVWSLCEHHGLPYQCTLDIGYLSAGSILGLSKLSRLAWRDARTLSTQENLVSNIARDMIALTGSSDVIVIGRGSHTCTEMRGIKTPSELTTSSVWGRFRTEADLRSDFYQS